MCQRLRAITHSSLEWIFGAWAKALLKCNKCIGIFCFIVYVLISKSAAVLMNEV